MKYFVIELIISCLNFINIIFKLLPVNKNKITFISRQSNEPSVDFNLLIDKLKHNYKIRVLTKKLEKGILSKFKYSLHILVQMYHIATSKLVILDSYCIPISILKHKKTLKVIQMWHAMGSLKKFGYSILDQEEGSESKMAKVMRMHKNYDYILTSSEKSKPNFAQAFGAPLEKFIIYSLPRVDYLTAKEYQKNDAEIIIPKYPRLDNNKKNILYVPTFRINLTNKLSDLINAVDYHKFNLIIKLHDGQELVYIDSDQHKEKTSIKINSLDFLRFADYIITDYSAIVYEAAILNKPLYFYAFDLGEYIDERGFYIDYQKEMPGYISSNIQNIMKKIKQNSYEKEKINDFKKDNIKYHDNQNTKRLVNFIIKIMKEENQ